MDIGTRVGSAAPWVSIRGALPWSSPSCINIMNEQRRVEVMKNSNHKLVIHVNLIACCGVRKVVFLRARAGSGIRSYSIYKTLRTILSNMIGSSVTHAI